LIRWVGLSRRSAARPPELSAGEKQRIAIARAVVNAPGLVLANAEHLFLLEPRLGAGNLLDDLPAPRLIEARTAGPGPEAARLQARLDAAAPGAVYDDHALWRGPLVRAATALRRPAWLATARHSVRLLLRQM
jgi:cell division transport system permease protein